MSRLRRLIALTPVLPSYSPVNLATGILLTSLFLSVATASTESSISTPAETVAATQHSQSDNADIFGLWLESKEQNVAVWIEPCEKQLCGYIYWLRKPLTHSGKPKLDKYNPDESLRHQPLCGLKLLDGFSQEEDRSWSDGEIYSPEDGYTFSSSIEPAEDGTLQIRGYVGIPLFGKTVNWHRPEDKLPPCQ